MINIISSDIYLSINYIENNRLAIAEVSKLYNGKWYFNRLSVPVELRGKGIATILMKNLQYEFKKRKMEVVCDVNPYGNMKRSQLIKFYQKFGFKKEKNKHDLFFKP